MIWWNIFIFVFIWFINMSIKSTPDFPASRFLNWLHWLVKRVAELTGKRGLEGSSCGWGLSLSLISGPLPGFLSDQCMVETPSLSGTGDWGVFRNRSKQEAQQFRIKPKVEVLGVFRGVGYPCLKLDSSKYIGLVFVFDRWKCWFLPTFQNFTVSIALPPWMLYHMRVPPLPSFLC